MRFPARIVKKYSDLLKVKIINPWKEATVRILAPRMKEVEKTVELERPLGLRKDSWSDEVTAQLDLLAAEYDKIAKQSGEIAAGIFLEANGISHAQWYAIAKRVLGVDLFAYEPWLINESKGFIQENVTLITKTKADVLSDINRLVMGGFRQGKRWETISGEIFEGTDLTEGVFDKLETRADLIARDQTSKLWGNLNEKRQEGAGISLYRWRTAEDERVRGNPGGLYPEARPSHFVMNGKYCSWADPTVYADTLDEAMAGKWKSRESIGGPSEHPGQPINDRCYAEAVFETLFANVQ
jgi:hypothetical protein